MEIFRKTAVFPGGDGRIEEMQYGRYGQIVVHKVKGIRNAATKILLNSPLIYIKSIVMAPFNPS